jgi:hypothetical protein
MGEKRYNSKFKDEDVVNIRKLYDSGNVTYLDIAIIYKCTKQAICLICRRKNWKQVA